MDERENQLLLNSFTKWCQWSAMKIRVDKCVAFGLKKSSTRSMQFQTKLFINKEIAPSLKSWESFAFILTLRWMIKTIRSKYNIFCWICYSVWIRLQSYHQTSYFYIIIELSSSLAVTNLSKTWVVENLDSVIARFVRKWSELPISATLGGIILPQNKFGLNFQLQSTKFLQRQNFLRSALKSSSSETIRSLWKSTSFGTNIQYDAYQNIKQVLKVVNTNTLINLPTN